MADWANSPPTVWCEVCDRDYPEYLGHVHHETRPSVREAWADLDRKVAQEIADDVERLRALREVFGR